MKQKSLIVHMGPWSLLQSIISTCVIITHVRAAVEKHPTLSPDKGGDEPWHDRRWRLNQERRHQQEEEEDDEEQGTNGANDENVVGGNGDAASSPPKGSQGDHDLGNNDQIDASSPSHLGASNNIKASNSPDAASPVWRLAETN